MEAVQSASSVAAKPLSSVEHQGWSPLRSPVHETHPLMQIEAQPRPRTKPPEARREELMNAAQALFLKKGVGATVIREITDSTEVAKGSFYLYFSSKEDIHIALAERFHALHVGNLDRATGQWPGTDWGGKLGAWVKAAATGFLDDGPLVSMFFDALPHIPDKRPNAIGKHLEELLGAGTEAGAWFVVDPGVTADFLLGGLRGVVGDALTGETSASRMQVVERLQQLFFRIVGLPEN